MKNLKFTNLNCLLKETNKKIFNRLYLLYIYMVFLSFFVLNSVKICRLKVMK